MKYYVTVIRNEHRRSQHTRRYYRLLNLLVISGPGAGRNIWMPMAWENAAWVWEGKVSDPRDLCIGTVMRVRVEMISFHNQPRFRVAGDDWELISIPEGKPRYEAGFLA